MKLQWHISATDKKRVQALVASQAHDAFVRNRIAKNVSGDLCSLSKSHVWHALVACLLTTQQRSGPGSKVQSLIEARPFPLSLQQVGKASNKESFVATTIAKFGGIRRGGLIGREIAENYRWFVGQDWKQLLRELESMRHSEGYQAERRVARWLAIEFRGLGPKQSRNFIQCLGLSRYEVPIDSRITKWLNSFGFPIELNATGLSDPAYYELVCDGFRELAVESGVLPCVLDAVVFSLQDGGAWEGRKILF